MNDYFLTNATFNLNGNLYVIKYRKFPTPDKPKYYIWNNTTNKYLSSLYKIKDENQFIFKQSKGNHYILKMENEKIMIRKKDRNYITEIY